eukprot:scaffold661_cov162-Ochromonas_danica.AAC.6
MSIMWWQLPTDILHSVCSEWLRWKDLSRLDVACAEKTDREAWLSSLNDLRISRGFPVSVSVLEDLVEGGLDIMESYCPALRSIEIDTSTSSDFCKEEQSVSLIGSLS